MSCCDSKCFHTASFINSPIGLPNLGSYPWAAAIANAFIQLPSSAARPFNAFLMEWFLSPPTHPNPDVLLRHFVGSVLCSVCLQQQLWDCQLSINLQPSVNFVGGPLPMGYDKFWKTDDALNLQLTWGANDHWQGSKLISNNTKLKQPTTTRNNFPKKQC